MQAVSRLLGHASISTTVDIYAHLVVDDLAAEIERALAG
jgi:site-specific recombinase XerD